MEAIANIVWFEALRDVFGDAVLRQHDQSCCLLEGPRKKRVEVSFHHGQEEGEVSSSTSTVPVQVDPETDLVPMSGGVERGTVQGHSHTQHSLSPPPGQIGDLPNVDWPMAGGLDGLDVQGYVAVVVLEFFDGSLLFADGIFRGYSSGMGLSLHSLYLAQQVSNLSCQLCDPTLHVVNSSLNMAVHVLWGSLLVEDNSLGDLLGVGGDLFGHQPDVKGNLVPLMLCHFMAEPL